MKRKRNIILDTNDDCSTNHHHPTYDEIKKSDYSLSEADRITVIVGINRGHIDCVINVSYEILFKKKWVTVLRFDSSHGFLHRHRRISLSDPNTTVENVAVIKRGLPKDWLPWARRYMNKKFYEEKVGFCKRSSIDILDI